jgi:peptidyl-prolyl cis-trans isomerase A (cyclophilin A)
VLALFVLLLVLISGCPRNPEGEDATPPPPPPPATTDFDLESSDSTASTDQAADGEAATSDADSATDDSADATADSAAAPEETAPPAEEESAPAADGSTVVVLDTTKGVIEITVRPEWAPIGAEHFLKLVKDKFYDGAPWFRVIEGFVAQCGVSANPEMNVKWASVKLNDEPVLKGNTQWTVCFGKTMAPNSRGAHIFINLVDNTNSLDPQGFACFGEVTKGMDVAQSLARVEYGDQGGLAGPGGMDAFKQRFPNADYIKTAYIKK